MFDYKARKLCVNDVSNLSWADFAFANDQYLVP